VKRDLRPGPALSGSSGLPPWLGYHALIYLLVFSTSIVVWAWLDQRSVEGTVAVLVVSLVIGSVLSILPTVLLTAVLWTLRRLGRVAFRILAVVVCCVPLVCVPADRYALTVFVPVQVAYGLILRQPRRVGTTEEELDGPPQYPAPAE
jgi:hypothetical protein